MDPFPIKQNDRLPYIEATLSDSGGNLTTLAGTTVYFVMKNAKTGAVAVRGLCVIVDATAKKVRYEWAVGDTAVAGVYRAEFEVNFAGRPWTFPQPGYLIVNVIPDLG